MKKFIAGLVLCASAGCTNLQLSYVEADALTYGALNPQVQQWIEKDEDMSDARKLDLKNLMSSWKFRIDVAKDHLGVR